MGAVHQQSTGGFSAAVSATLAVAYGGAVTAGNMLACGFVWGNVTQTATVSDSVNGAWTAVAASLLTAGSVGSGGRLQIFYKENTAAGTPTVTATASGTNAYRVLNIAEYSGMLTSGALDASGTATGNSAAPSASVTTTVDHDLVVSECFVANTSVAGSGMNSRVITDGNGFEDVLDKSPLGAQAMTWTQATGQWAVIATAFKVAATVGGLYVNIDQGGYGPVGMS